MVGMRMFHIPDICLPEPSLISDISKDTFSVTLRCCCRYQKSGQETHITISLIG